MSDDPEYEVGRNRPPTHSRWKTGQSGNPKGRPKTVKSGIPHEKVLGRMMTITVDGVPTRMRADRALVLRIFQKAAESGRVTVRRAVRAALSAYEKQAKKARRPDVVFSVEMVNGQVDRALEYLGMASRIDIYRPSCRLLLEPWVVEAALALRGSHELTLDEQKRIYSVTRAPRKVRWPAWWDLPACESFRPVFDIPEVAPWSIS